MYAIIPAALLLCAGLLYFEKKESTKGLLWVKPPLSVLFVVTALIQPHPDTTYFYLVLAGLLLCLVGDVCLIFFFNRKVFTAGLASFLAGHIMYSIAFSIKGSAGSLVWSTIAVCCAVSAFVFFWLRPSLGAMRGPVVAYIVIISATVIAASALMSNAALDMNGRMLVYGAAIIFYLSDVFVARHRFVKKEFVNRAVGLPLYYLAQFMIALSTGLL